MFRNFCLVLKNDVLGCLKNIYIVFVVFIVELLLSVMIVFGWKLIIIFRFLYIVLVDGFGLILLNILIWGCFVFCFNIFLIVFV